MAFKPQILAIADGGTFDSSFGTSNGVVVYNGTRLVNYAGPQISTGGFSTNTAQPCFAAYLNTSVANVTGDSTLYHIIFDTKQFDNGTNFSTSTGSFTAPVSGRYLFTYSVGMGGTGVAHTAATIRLVTTGMTFSGNVFNPGVYANVNGVAETAASFVVNMSLNDTAYVQMAAYNGTKVVSAFGVDGGGITYTSFTGHLIC
jgi:hypothetical protein